MANRGVTINAAALDQACSLLHIGNDGGKGSEYLGVSGNTLRGYRSGRQSVSDSKLSRIFAALLDKAHAHGIGLEVLYCLYQTVGAPAGNLSVLESQFAAGGAVPNAASQLPKSLAVLEAYSQRIARGIDQPFILLMARGNAFLETRDFVKAAEAFEQAIKLEPENATALLNAAKAYLQIPMGNLKAAWQRGSQLVARAKKGFPENSLSAIHCEFWRLIALMRDPTKAEPQATFLTASAGFKDLHARLLSYLSATPSSDDGPPDEKLFLDSLQSMAAMSMFRSEQPKLQKAAIARFHKLIRTMRGDSAGSAELTDRDIAIKYFRAVTLKRAGNCYCEMKRAADSKEADRQEAEQLLKALDSYERSCRVFEELKMDVERAMVRYSMGSAYTSLGDNIARRRRGSTYLSKARDLFAEAERASLDAIQTLPAQYSDDIGRAEYNLAEIHHNWPGHDSLSPTDRLARRHQLGKAVRHFLNSLKSFPKSYNVSEWALIHYPLAKSLTALAGLGFKDRVEMLIRAIASMKAACSIVPSEHPAHEYLKSLREQYEKLPPGDHPKFDSIQPAD